MRAARRTLTSSTPLKSAAPTAAAELQERNRLWYCRREIEVVETKLEGQRRISSAIL